MYREHLSKLLFGSVDNVIILTTLEKINAASENRISQLKLKLICTSLVYESALRLWEDGVSVI